MPLKVGDKVRSDQGIKGQIVVIAADGNTAMIRLIHNGPGARIVSLPLASLTRVEEASKPDPPA